MKKFDASIPRKMFWSKDIGGTVFCPQCQGRLESENHTYLMFTREGSDSQQFVVGNDHGYFCVSCSVIVLDYDAFAEIAIAGNPSSRSFEFTVPGIVDLNAIPKDKADIPLGDNDNPIPLMSFTNCRGSEATRRKRLKNRRRKARRKHKISR